MRQVLLDDEQEFLFEYEEIRPKKTPKPKRSYDEVFTTASEEYAKTFTSQIETSTLNSNVKTNSKKQVVIKSNQLESLNSLCAMCKNSTINITNTNSFATNEPHRRSSYLYLFCEARMQDLDYPEKILACNKFEKKEQEEYKQPFEYIIEQN
ncbi:hypothetical protein [Helicobacter pylori]|uniref:hypothetical protein n=1 Tax=Helicobacter pylori TaxID=210 RepID=UPI001E6276D6|nr:hypothetical protein [Helicobacter pylori]